MDSRSGFADVEAASADHGLSPDLGGRPVEIVLWTDDTDRVLRPPDSRWRALAQRSARLPVGSPPRLGGGPG
jgi:hypothetical protein